MRFARDALDDFLPELSGFDGGYGSTMTFEGETILVLPRNHPGKLVDIFGGLTHGIMTVHFFHL
jgi:hypothetical protein